MYQFKEEINHENFYLFDKHLVLHKHWAKLPLASKNIYPVIASFCDKQGKAFPSQQTIAILSGRTEKTVRKGIEGLLRLHGFNVSSKVTNKGHKQKVYNIKRAAEMKGRVVAIYKSIFEGGNWCELTQAAQALYIPMKVFSFFRGEVYSELENIEYFYNVQAMIDDGEYQSRKYDFVNAEFDILASYAGIGESTVPTAIASLEKRHLIKPTVEIDDYPTWKIFTIPPKFYKRDWLNKKVAERYSSKN